MATAKTASQVMMIVWMKAPSRRPADASTLALCRQMWEAIYAPVPDCALLEAAARWMAKTVKVWPDDDPLAEILQMAQPVMPETSGDCMELALEAISKFGRYHEDKADAWLKERSPLVAAVVRRFGFVNLCDCENLEVARGQIRAMFQEEKERAARLGGVLETAENLDSGKVLIDCDKKLESLINGLADRKALPGKVAA